MYYDLWTDLYSAFLVLPLCCPGEIGVGGTRLGLVTGLIGS